MSDLPMSARFSIKENWYDAIAAAVRANLDFVAWDAGTHQLMYCIQYKPKALGEQHE